jgi:hypothetical protein
VRFLVCGDDARRILRLGEAIDRAAVLIDPVLDEPHIVLALRRQVSLMRLGDIGCADLARPELVHVDEVGFLSRALWAAQPDRERDTRPTNATVR